MALKRSPEVIHEAVDQPAMLVPPDGSELIWLNAAGTMVWDLLAMPADARGLAAQLHPRFEEIPLEELERDIEAFLDSMRERGLVQESDA